jgi:phosphoribosylamine---glycine ligase
MMDKGQLATAGSYPLICVGTGDTVSQARAAAYRVVDRVEIPVKTVHRLDIGARLARQLPQLQEHGFAKGLVYSA